jgi:hypothetical protein
VIEGDQVLVRQVGDKRLRIDAVGGATRQVALAASEVACVSDAELLQLVALGRAIEGHFGAPQDIEWALDEGRRPAILQARAITTLYPLPDDAPLAGVIGVLQFQRGAGGPAADDADGDPVLAIVYRQRAAQGGAFGAGAAGAGRLSKMRGSGWCST